MKKQGVVVEEKRECAAFCLYLEVRDKSGTPVAALSSATYLQDRAATRGKTDPQNSAVAVQLTADFMPELIAWARTPSPAIAMSKGLDRDRAVDETGGQIAVFGRLGSRPFTRPEMERMFRTPGGMLYRVRDNADLADWVGLPE